MEQVPLLRISPGCTAKYSASISEHFADLPDPRKEGMIEHKLLDIITISLCAVICGADDWVKVEVFGEAKYEWLKTFLELPHGIPSHDTFNRVFSMLPAHQFQKCFMNWIAATVSLTKGQIIPIDGKTLRRSYDRSSGKAAIHMVSAWAHTNRVVLGQIKTEEKSNEITAIPELLNLLNIRNSVVTIDAMGCQKAIAAQIIDQEGDYVLALKGNQGNFHQDVIDFFADAEHNDFNGIPYDYHETFDKNHGRIEIRRYWTVKSIYLPGEEKAKWKGLNIIGMVESERHADGKTTVERRYYIASLENDAKCFGYTVRAHWSIENTLHWSLDVSFKEDACRIRKGSGAENFAVLRHMAVSLLQQEKTEKTGAESKRLKAALDTEYLRKVLTAQ
ncbi:MAG: ISAs1 family transposase [Gammaproteobacteria bacterium]|nr:ISAs1 family transposase [Gammaproteobacteria bacterium]